MSKIDKILVLYSSQTGTAESIAQLYVDEDLPSVCSQPSLYSTNAYLKIDSDLSLLSKYDYVLFVIATTGAGDFPDTALSIMRILRRLDKKIDTADPTTLLLSSVRMLNIGLGDTNYDRFNGGIQQMETLLTRLGAHKVQPTVLADDGTGLEVGVEKWRKDTIDYFKSVILERNSTSLDPHAKTKSNLAATEAISFSPSSLSDDLLISSSLNTVCVDKLSDDTIPQNALPSTVPQDIIILYGSQTGTAESIAELFIKDNLPQLEAKKLINTPQCYSIAAYMKIDPELSKLATNYAYVLFIISTTGAGDFPDTCLSLMRIIRRLDKKIDQNDPKSLVFSKMKMLNLGLGDTNYDRFNGGIQQVEKILLRLGAQKALPTVLADDGTGLEVGVEKWRQETLSFLETTLSTPSISQSSTSTSMNNMTDSNNDTTTTSTDSVGQNTETQDFSTQTFFKTPIFSTAPPKSVCKPDFLLKQHQTKISSYLVKPGAFSTAIAQYNNTPTPTQESSTSRSQFTYGDSIIDINNTTYIHRNSIRLFTNIVPPNISSQKKLSKDFQDDLSNEIKTSLHIYSQDSLLLQQYISGHNLHQFLQYDAHVSNNQHIASIQQQLYNQLSEHEYGYTNINSLPLFANISTLQLPIQSDIQHPEVKPVIDMTLTLPYNTTQVLGQIPISVNTNPTITIDKFKTDNNSTVEVRSLYRPGDSISIICPNRLETTQSLLKYTQLEDFAQHGVVLNTISTTATTDALSNPVNTITSPITHDHITQPCSQLLNSTLMPSLQFPSNQSETSQSLTESIINIGNVLINYTTSHVISILPTIESVFNYSLDLTSPMKKSLIRSFAEMCTKIDPQNTLDIEYQRCVVELLLELASKDGRSKLKEYFDDKSLTLLDFLQFFTFPSEINACIDHTDHNFVKGVKKNAFCPQLDILIELCGSLKPRSYSLSSSPYHALVESDNSQSTHINDKKTYNLAVQNDINNILKSNAKTFIAGSVIRFSATLTNDEIASIESIPPAGYYEAKKWSEVQMEQKITNDICNIPKKNAINVVNDMNDDISTLSVSQTAPSSNKRIYNGLCTHWFVQLFQDMIDLQSAIINTEDDFITFMTSQSTSHSNPARFHGTVITINTDASDFSWNRLSTHTSDYLTLSIPFFFHTSPTFHPPTLLTQSTRDSASEFTALHESTNNNMLLLGPGTGASPFLSFIEHKLYTNILTSSFTQATPITLPLQFNETTASFNSQVDFTNPISISTHYNALNTVFATESTIFAQSSSHQQHGVNYGDITLYTGNRYRHKDYLYSQHWYEHLVTNQSLTTLHSVFSRELPRTVTTSALGPQSPIPQGEVKKQRYVQDLLHTHSYEVAKHVLTGGFIYVCGDGVSMSKQVQKVVENCISMHCVELGSLYSINYDVIVPQSSQDESMQQSNSNPTTYITRFNNETVSAALIDYMNKDTTAFKTQTEQDTWARGIIAIMVKSGRYNADVW